MTTALVAGWFSFPEMGATAGDIFARDLCVEWLTSAGIRCDVATAAPFTDGIDWASTDAASYDAVVFVCGPFGNGWPVTDFLEHFEGCRLIGLNLTMLQRLDEWDPFDLLIERDSSRASRPDISFVSSVPAVPLVGVVLVHPQKEYRDAMHEQANAAVEQLLAGHDVARVPIDTRLDENSTGLTSAAQVESMIARMDAVVTTRLHGTVLSIKNGVPPVVIDPIAGGRKVLAQARTIGWPLVFTADELDAAALDDALAFCLSEAGREEVARVRAAAEAAVHATRNEFVRGLRDLGLRED